MGDAEGGPAANMCPPAGKRGRAHRTAAVATKNNDSCAFSTLFKFLPEFMTRLIQWGHKPSKNSNSVENHIFRGRAALRLLLCFN